MKPNQQSKREDITASTFIELAIMRFPVQYGTLLTRVEERNNLRNDEGKNPCHKQDTSPRSPADDSVAAQMLGVLEHTEEDESSGD